MFKLLHIVCVTATRNLITAAQVAKRFGVTTVTVHRWIKSGRLHATKLPGETGAYLIDERDADRLAKQRAA